MSNAPRPSFRQVINTIYRRYDDFLRRLYRRLPRTTLLDPLFLLYFYYNRGLQMAAQRYARGVLLDVGCGHQPYRQFFEDKVESYIGLDFPSGREMLIPSPADVALPDVYADAHRLPVRDAAIDTLLCLEVLEHLSEPAQALGECFRVLRPDGHLILTVPFCFHVHGAPHDFRRYTEYGLRHLMERAGFQVVVVHRHGSFGAVLGLMANVYLFHHFFEVRRQFAVRLLLGTVKVVGTIPLLLLVMVVNIMGYLLNLSHDNPHFVVNYLIVGRKAS
ncbi:MAG: class I SAM-dependent methyltransferase [Abditibacteriales bacterium]|nr:class I SAM-dependent methyltransferase [Abditibacteriales bacterium]MDW8366521.1 class I SAM-dependent methyltransferase [Abditibacteriales bacterium]